MTCTKCNRTFGSYHALRVHNGRYHKKSDALPGRAQLAKPGGIEGLPWIKLPASVTGCATAAARVGALLEKGVPETERTLWESLRAHLIAAGELIHKRAIEEAKPQPRPVGFEVKL